MTTKISVYNLDNTVTSAIGSGGGGVIISSLQIATAAWVVKDDTAVDTAGGFAIINGSGFASGCNVIIGSQNATAVSFVSSTTLRVTIPAQAAGTYTVYVVNPNGAVGIIVNGLTYSGTPSWVTGSTLTSGQVNSAISIQLSATGESVTYALQAGSSLPSGLTLTSGGLLSGTVTGITSETTYNFTIEAIDAQAQDSPRAFSITISSNDADFRNVSLLLSANTPGNTFVSDASNNAFAITVNGDTRPNNFGPYTPGYYSNFFDGTGDWINTASSSEFNLSGSNFTVEFWVYPTSSASQQTLINFAASLSDYTGTHIWFNTSRQIVIDNGSTSQSAFTGGTLTLNSWNLVTIVRNSGTTTAYINGLSVGSNSYTPSTSAVVAVGRLVTIGYDFVGYISNLRVSKNIVRYSSNFSVPTLPFSTDANTSLLTCSSNRLIDTSNNAFAITRNGDVRVDGFDPFVPASNTATFGSGYFDGNGDYLSLPAAQTALQPGNGNFTIEFWYYISTAPGGYINIFSYGATGASLRLFLFTTNSFTLFEGATLLITANNSVIINAWNHVAVVRNGTTIVLYVNGVSVGSATNSSNFVNNLNIGFETGQTSYTGYLSNFRLVKGTAVYTSAFTPPTAPLTAIANTSLLTLQTNQPINNHMFVDNSTVNNLITRAGNATQGSFSPYSGAWSNYFDGTGDYLSAPNTSTNFGTGDFTIEAWFYKTGSGTTIVGNQDGGTDNNYFVFDAVNAQATMQIRDGAGQAYAYGPAIVNNTWTHIAVSRASGSVRVFVNGVSGTPVTITKSITSRLTIVGAFLYSTFESYFTGYISNLRVVKGTAVYTTNFTPPTAPLTATANTSLLTCADNRFIDDSNNIFTLTRNGDVSVQKFSPFTMQTQIVPTSYSVYFDGTGDFLTTTMPALGTDSFTVEFWFYPTDPTRAYLILDKGFRDGNFSLQTDYLNTGMFYLNVGGTGYNISFTPPIVNQWNHIAICRNSSSLRFFLNGVQLGTTQTNSGNVTTGTLYIGGASTTGSGYLTTQGYISNLRITTTAVYTANFTSPTAPLTSIANTSLLACQSTTLIDNSNNAFAITQNGDARPIQQNPFGYTNANTAAYSTSLLSGSMYFDGTGDSLSIPDNINLRIVGSDYTVEAWVYPLGTPDATFGATILTNNTNGSNGWLLRINSTRIFALVYPGVASYTFGSAIPFSSWTHVAIVKTGSAVVGYINGVRHSIVSSSPAEVNGTWFVGSDRNSLGYYTGYISDLRIIKGRALYANAFVPPAAPLTAASNTTLLLNGTSGGIIDSSMVNQLETLGDARINTSITKFAGKSSIFFDGTGDYLLIKPSIALEFGSASFTIEFWWYPTATTRQALYHGSFGTDWSIGIDYSSVSTNQKIGIWASSNGTSWNLINADSGGNGIGTTTVTQNAWNHIAFVRNGTTWMLFVNGNRDLNLTGISGSIVNRATSQKAIAAWFSTGSVSQATGYMSDFRITNGVARYTANFTPATTPLIQF